MFIDRVMVTPDGELVVLDLKTGARTPSSDLQLAVYAAGIERKYGVRPTYGAYWMAREGITSQLSPLAYLPADRIEALVENFDKARKAGIFLPNTTNCFYCGVAQYCEWSKK
jgi:RecB family exonuclease